ncbi:MAG: site-specific DNA-methyltransferase [Planctomycetes bacterium]|nr:site-specific DNA-methyltransferase [Planctomycetota bacterium]
MSDRSKSASSDDNSPAAAKTPRKKTARKKVAAKKATTRKGTRKPVPHCNELDGKRWIQNSISVWSDIRKTTEENRLKHPAMFPGMLVERLIESFLRPEANVILDPFCGSGSTVVAAERLGKTGIGFELSPEYVELATSRLNEAAEGQDPRSTIHEVSSFELLTKLEPESIDLCITSPPYWNILNQRRTADYKEIRHYGNLDGDLGTIEDYGDFLTELTRVFADVFVTLKAGAYCCVIVMDLRKKSRFYPFHSDLAARLQEVGFIFDDLIIWNRQSEYNNLRPLGYPAVFRVNKVHEFVVLMQKPRA